MKIQKETLNEKVVKLIKKAIIENTYKEGQRLPSETELASMYGVNRLTVRVALQKLAAQGLLETRVGEGSFVKAFSLEKYLQEVSDFYTTPEMLDDVCEFRKAMETDCIKLAIERATAEDILAIKGACCFYEEIRQSVDIKTTEGIEKLARADLEFHAALCAAAHNSLYMITFNAVKSAIFNYLKMIIRHRAEDIENNHSFNWFDTTVPDMHTILVSAIEQKNHEECKNICLSIIDYKADSPPHFKTTWGQNGIYTDKEVSISI